MKIDSSAKVLKSSTKKKTSKTSSASFGRVLNASPSPSSPSKVYNPQHISGVQTLSALGDDAPSQVAFLGKDLLSVLKILQMCHLRTKISEQELKDIQEKLRHLEKHHTSAVRHETIQLLIQRIHIELAKISSQQS